METRKEVEQRLIGKAMKDNAFRKRLIDSPGETIGEEMGIKIPGSITLQVVEERPDTFYLVLPSNQPESAQEELSETELQAIAAGGLESDFWDHFYTRLNCIFQ